MRKKTASYGVLVGNREGKRPFGRPRHAWEGSTRWFKYDRDKL
jgi:hypothetical protein